MLGTPARTDKRTSRKLVSCLSRMTVVGVVIVDWMKAGVFKTGACVGENVQRGSSGWSVATSTEKQRTQYIRRRDACDDATGVARQKSWTVEHSNSGKKVSIRFDSAI